MGLKPLKRGGGIGIWAASSAIAPEAFSKGVSVLEQAGFRVKVPVDPSLNFSDKFSFCSDTPDARRKVLYELLEDADVEAILCARGGYGSMELLEGLDFKFIKKYPKPIVGVSDGTAVLNTISKKCALPTIHGQALLGISKVSESAEAKESFDVLERLLSDADFDYQLQGKILREGEAQGVLAGGNLSIICALLGTPWEIDLKNKILVLEDINEAPYRVRRMLYQLKLSGGLSKLSGLVLGEFKNCEIENGPNAVEVVRMSLADILSDSSFPIVYDFPFGHGDKNYPFVIGREAEIREGELRFEKLFD